CSWGGPRGRTPSPSGRGSSSPPSWRCRCRTSRSPARGTCWGTARRSDGGADILPRMLRPLAALCSLALLLVPAVASAAPPALRPPNRDYDQTHLIVRVVPRIADGVVDGRTTVRFASAADPLTVLRLHCEETSVMAVKDADQNLLEWKLGDGVLAVTLS